MLSGQPASAGTSTLLFSAALARSYDVSATRRLMRTPLLPIGCFIVGVFVVSYLCWALQRSSGPVTEPRNKYPGGLAGVLWRLVAISVLCASMIMFYAHIDDDRSVSRTTVVMPSWVPFWPAFAPVYLVMLFVPWVLPLSIRDTKRFFACLLALACGFLMIVSCWMLIPTTLPRPPMPEGGWNAVYRGIASTDAPNNVMPAGHAMGPIVVAWFAGRDRPTWRWPLVGMLVLGLPSIALIWQHRPIDILIGIVPAAIGIAVGETLIRWRKSMALPHHG